MKAIWKFEITNDCFISMPKGAKVLSAQVQTSESGTRIVLWARVRLHQLTAPEIRAVTLLPTGMAFDADTDFGEFIDTVQCGSIVYHVFVK